MNKVLFALTTLFAMLVAACVTINVYFPEAAAEQAADRIIERVRGESTDSGASLHRFHDPESVPLMVAAAEQFLNAFAPRAEAQGSPNFDASSPEVTALENSLAKRFQQLKSFYDSGAIGMDENGLVEIRDRNLIPLKDRNSVLQLVSAQNNDWNALYQEIADLNGHPEWVDNIRRTFASRWVAKANKGWWYREGGSWRQK
jgi:uncharacterized protein YdbL (DUF1318 family)